MCDSYSKIFSSAYLGLGQPTDDLLSKLELSNIVTQRLSLRLESVRQSEQGVAIARSQEFTLAADQDEIDLTDEIEDFVIPMWVERQTLSIGQTPVWEFVPTVNISMLQEQRQTLTSAVAFHGENPRQVKATFSYNGQIAWWGIPQNRIFRVWYLPTLSMPNSETAQIDLPENLVNILVYDVYVRAIPLLKVNIAKQLTDRPELKPYLESLNDLYVQYKMEQKEFDHWFRKWKDESRGAHRPRNRPDVLQDMRAIRGYSGYYGGEN
ncbi:hypothetical protein [Geitlerinema calcuttense]|uniref:Uncharacterized protein n=1 Tax=Geitlerinema calcuttense NRMC-F 0142 TaxID=2922238 RepID=A0ABT7LV94_9CYAN|nr:hypothetical protein [Geitlerinema calcuttense]MDL5055894.1 hypothetical protein [Geitlerinema calcuttense NRMC-F 0142]